MYCEKCGSELKKGAKFCGSCGTEVKMEKKSVNGTKGNKTLFYIIGGALIVILLVVLLNSGYSDNVKLVRSWQNAFLDDYHVNFGEVIDYSFKNVKWKDTKYEGEDAVLLTGTEKETGDKIRAILYVNNDHGTMFAYYEVNGEEEYALNLPFLVTEYAEETAEHLGRD